MRDGRKAIATLCLENGKALRDLPSIDRHEAARIIRKVEGDLIQIDRKFIGLGGITMVQMHSPFLLKAYGVAKVTELDPVETAPIFQQSST